MRITAGTKRGLVLNCPPGRVVRPTLERVRQAIFNILGQDMTGLRIWDFYSGTGAMGLEALSRGAAFVTFVEKDPDVLTVLRDNIRRSGFADRCVVKPCDVKKAFKETVAQKVDLVFSDPPYSPDDLISFLNGVRGWEGVGPETMVVVEHRKTIPIQLAATDGLSVVDTRAYGDTQVTFIRRALQ